MKQNYLNAKSWPFEEAKKILKKINCKIPEKGYVLFETGYGPSGLPHIGTFGEVVRTYFVMNAFSLIAPEIPIKLFCISDDIDALRKVPDNIPNQNLIKENLGKPLTSVPDPFEKCESYGHYMNEKLKVFLNEFEFEYHFISATDYYKSGQFDDALLKVQEKYDDIMNIMLPSLREERRKTYSPFMPIDEESGKVIDKGVIDIDKENKLVIYLDEKGNKKTAKITGGGCKLQWKVDFATRWYNLKVDYEIYGKEHLANEKIYRDICKTLGGIPPVNFSYELFLDQNGEKISKSLGNGIAVEKWLSYAPKESLSLYMFQKPKRAKRLYFDVIPKAMDEFLSFSSAYHRQNDLEKIDNPIFHVDFGKTPENLDINYSLLLNLASACNPENDDILWKYINKYSSNIRKEKDSIMVKMVTCAINYYNDFIKKYKKYKRPNADDKKILIDLKNSLQNLWNSQEEINRSNLQNIIFAVGRKNDYDKSNMKELFSNLYQLLLGQEKGPRLGSFIEIYGINNFIKLIDKILSDYKEES